MKKMSLLFAALLASAAAFAQTVYSVDKAHSNLSFNLVHLSISEVEGSFKKYEAKISASKEDFSDAVFEVTAEVGSISTDNEMRDGHIKSPDIFDAAKYPTIAFKSTSISKVSDKQYKLLGDLTAKGITKQIALDLTIFGTTTDRQGKKVVGIKVTGWMKRSDFGIGNMPSAMVSDDIQIHAGGEFKAN